MINTTIGKYKIKRLIGEGGMASVYEAEHEMLGTKVAIKVLNPILSANTQIKERFRNEARLMASLDHPNITKVLDFDEQPQQLSIVMEYLNGEDLNQKIKKSGPLSEKEITDIFSQTLLAFQYAHEKGIVHRDIKPSNIFILPNGHVKILDFGIAKLFGQGNEMTQTGTQMGTPIYMSPEQVKSDKSIDHRSDIYSLGVTMFFLINGKPPYNYDTDSQFDIFTKIVYEGLPDFLIQSKFKDVVFKACNKNREDRFQSCEEYINEIHLPQIINAEINNQTFINTAVTENSTTDVNEKNSRTSKAISSEKTLYDKVNKDISANSLLFHLMPGLVVLFLLTNDYYNWFNHFAYDQSISFAILNYSLHGDFLIISLLSIFCGFLVFRFRYHNIHNGFYKMQVKRILYFVPGLLMLTATNYQFDTWEVIFSDSRDPFHVVFFNYSILPEILMFSIVLIAFGLFIYIYKLKNEKHK
jgi:serine/threonine protein kinase